MANAWQSLDQTVLLPKQADGMKSALRLSMCSGTDLVQSRASSLLHQEAMQCGAVQSDSGGRSTVGMSGRTRV